MEPCSKIYESSLDVTWGIIIFTVYILTDLDSQEDTSKSNTLMNSYTAWEGRPGRLLSGLL